MIKILLCSNSSLKEQAVKKWLKIYLKEVFEISKFNINDKLLPPQPMNNGGKLSCSDRILNVKKEIDLSKYDYIVSIESSLNIKDNKIFDTVNICIENCITLEKFEYIGQEIEINYKIMEKYPSFLKIIEDLCLNYKQTYKNYIYDGSEMTIGQIINHYYPEIPDNNWMKFICNIDRISQITKGLNQLTKKIKDDYSNN
jgi:hypothetical protein